MATLEQIKSRIAAATAAILALLDRAIVDPSIEAALGINGGIAVRDLSYLRQIIADRAAKLDAALTANDREQALLEAADPQPSARDLDQIGMSVRVGSALEQALTEQLRAAVALFDALSANP